MYAYSFLVVEQDNLCVCKDFDFYWSVSEQVGRNEVSFLWILDIAVCDDWCARKCENCGCEESVLAE